MDEKTPSESTAEKPLAFSEDQPEPPKKEPKKETPPGLQNTPEKEPRGTKWMTLIIIVAVLVLLGGALWFFVLSDDSSEEGDSANQESDAETSLEASSIPVPSYDIDQVIYGFGVSFESNADIFTRPAEGGDRESLFTLNKITSVDFTTLGDQAGFVQSEKFAFVIDNKEIYVGSALKAAELVYTHPEGDTEKATGVLSVVISPDGNRAAFTAITSDTNTPQVWVMDANGKNAELLVDNASIGPLQWSHDNQRLMFGPNILGAGAQLETPYVMNVETKDKTPIGPDDSPFAYPVYAFSPDGTKVAYAQPTIDRSRATDDVIGYYVGKPYTVKQRDLTNGEETTIATVDNDPMPSSISWQHGVDQFAFSIGGALYESGSLETGIDPLATPVYETTTSENIDIIYAVDGLNALVGSLQDDGTYIVYNINIMETDRTEIMQTTDATTPIGILLK